MDMFDDTVRRPSRRKWTIFRMFLLFTFTTFTDGARVPQGKGNGLAEDGDADSQVLLAKQLLLENNDDDTDEDERAKQGVYWLIKASQQGHAKATEYLRQCVVTGRGISSHNFLDVQKCLKISDDEKRTVKVARDIFNAMSEGEDHITSDQLRNALNWSKLANSSMSEETRKQLYKNLIEGTFANNDTENENWLLRLEDNNVERITEDMIVVAAHKYSCGELPEVGNNSKLIDLEIYRRKSLTNLLIYSLRHPFISMNLVFWSIMNILKLQRSYSYFSNASIFLKFLITFAFFSIIKFQGLSIFSPTVIYYSSFVVMICATCQILCHKKDFSHFRSWSNLFLLCTEGNFSPDWAEIKHWQKIRPYCIWFFVSLLIHLAARPFAHLELLCQSQLTVISSLFMLTGFYLFTMSGPRYYYANSRSLDFLGMLSVIFQIIANFPYRKDTIISFIISEYFNLHLPEYASYIVDYGIEFCLNFCALFYLFTFAILLKMAARYNRSGIYTDFMPHCITLTWWHLTVLCSKGADFQGIVSTSLALAGLIACVPLAFLMTILLPIYVWSVKLQEFSYYLTSGVSTGIALLLTTFIMITKNPRRTITKYLAAMQIILTLAATWLLLADNHYVIRLSETYNMDSNIEWFDFVKHCELKNYESMDFDEKFKAGVRCFHLIGSTVNAKAYVKDVRVSKIFNPILLLTNDLPTAVKKYIVCSLGGTYTINRCPNSEPENVCKKKVLNICHIDNWNWYEMNLTVQISRDNDDDDSTQLNEHLVTLVTDYTFYNFTKALRANDLIRFSGILMTDKGNVLTLNNSHIVLYSIGCELCSSDIPDHTNGIDLKGLFMNLENAIKYVLNFLFNPLIVVK